MILIDIVPNHSGDISKEEAELITLTREWMVSQYMSRHLKKSRAKKFIETIDLLNDLAELFDGLVKLSNVTYRFAKHCEAIPNADIHTLSSKLANLSSVFYSKEDPLDTTPFINEYLGLPDDDLRDQETSVLYQRVLNMTNLYSLITRLSNELAARIKNQSEGTLKELAETIHRMTERVRYGRSK